MLLDFKVAVTEPLLKIIPHFILIDYRPIANLPLSSKILKKVVIIQF